MKVTNNQKLLEIFEYISDCGLENAGKILNEIIVCHDIRFDGKEAKYIKIYFSGIDIECE